MIHDQHESPIPPIHLFIRAIARIDTSIRQATAHLRARINQTR